MEKMSKRNLGLKIFMALAALSMFSCTNVSSTKKPKTTVTGSTELAQAQELETQKDLVLRPFGENLSLIPEEYFSKMNLETEGLGKVKQAAKSEQWQVAAEELLTYYRERFFGGVVKELRSQDKKSADLALKHYFKGNKGYPEIFRGTEIDWLTKADIKIKLFTIMSGCFSITASIGGRL